MHVSVSLMHCCRGCCVTPAFVPPPRCWSSAGKPRDKRKTQGTNVAPAAGSQGQSAAFMYVGHSAASPLAPEGMFGSRDGSMNDGWRKEQKEGGKEGRVPAFGLHLAVYLESLLMTRISAPFSSLRRWLSALRSTRTWMKTKSHFTSPTKSTTIQQEWG